MREFLAASEELVFRRAAARSTIWSSVRLAGSSISGCPRKTKGSCYLSAERTQSAADHSPDSAVSPKRRGAAAAAAAAAFPTRYTPGDIALLAAADAAHEGLSGPAVRRILWREYCVYHKEAYQRLASISSSHIYNLRRGAAYRQHHVHHTKTRARAVSIGERRKPDHRGRPGYLRVEPCIRATPPPAGGSTISTPSTRLTQWQIVGCCQTISESHLIPVLEAMLHQASRGFIPTTARSLSITGSRNCSTHCWWGSSPSRGRIAQPTTRWSRARMGRWVRKHIGHEPIGAEHAGEVSAFLHGRVQSLLELPSPLRIRHRGGGREGQAAAPLPPETTARPTRSCFRSINGKAT